MGYDTVKSTILVNVKFISVEILTRNIFPVQLLPE